MSDIVNKTSLNKNYPLMTFVLFWTGLVVMVSLYVTIPLISFFLISFKHLSAKLPGLEVPFPSFLQ